MGLRYIPSTATEGMKKSAHPWWEESFHRKVSSAQPSTAGRMLQMLMMLEVKLRSWLRRKITRVLLALLRANPNSKPTPNAAVKNTASNSKTSKGEFSRFCSVPGWKTCGKLKQQQSNPWPRWQKKATKSQEWAEHPSHSNMGRADMHLPPGSSQSCTNTATLTPRHLSTTHSRYGFTMNSISHREKN